MVEGGRAGILYEEAVEGRPDSFTFNFFGYLCCVSRFSGGRACILPEEAVKARANFACVFM